VELTPELERTIRENNAIDMAVYAEFAKRLRGIRESLMAYLNTAAGRRSPVVKKP
jgi:hypothetical protein